MYVMHIKLCKDEANVATDSSGEIWHKRLGHMSKKGMHILANQKLLPEVKGMHLERCDAYEKIKYWCSSKNFTPKLKESRVGS